MVIWVLGPVFLMSLLCIQVRRPNTLSGPPSLTQLRKRGRLTRRKFTCYGAFRLPFSGRPCLKNPLAMGSLRKWTTTISFIASCIYFLVIITQIPLFRVPCSSGICTTPIEVTAPQLLACDWFPSFAVKALVYPGAIANALVKKEAFPSYNKPSAVKAADAIADLQRLEVLIGSYLAVAGAFWSLMKPGRMSFYGVLLILWGLVREIMFKKSTSPNVIHIYPAMSLACCCAFLSLARNVRRMVRSCRGLQIVKEKRS